MKKDSQDLEKLLLLKGRSQNRTYVKDKDLQIQIPSSIEGATLENTNAFKNIYKHYMHEAGSGHARAGQEVVVEMEEAETSFQSMMEMRNSIVEAYQDLVKK